MSDNNQNYFESRNLLVLSSRYPNKEGSPDATFVKSQVDILKKYFRKVVVIATPPYIPKVMSRFMQPRRMHESQMQDYHYDNVWVYYTHDIILPFEFSKRKWGDKALKKSKKILSDINFKPYIIHAHFTWPSGYAAVKLGKELKIPVTITIHENQDWFMKEYNSGDEKIYWTWKNADALIRVNKKDVPLLRKINPNVYSIPNGFDPHKLQVLSKNAARKYLDSPIDKKIVFSLGGLIERKGFQYLIKAMRKIPNVRKDILCFIGGDGPFRGRLEDLIQKYDLQDNIKLLGFISDKDLKYWMNAADMFVLPSLSEGNPTVMFEALGVGLPFVGTAVGGVPEIITSEDYGLLCPPKNPDCLAEKILEALNRQWDREKIREYAQQFTWENIAEEILEIYHKVMSKENSTF